MALTSSFVCFVAAVQDFYILHNDIEGWGPVPRDVVNALTPEKAVKHARKMLTRDCRMRIFMPKDNHHGAMYLCNQAQVNLADGNSSGTSPLLLPLLLSCHDTAAHGSPSALFPATSNMTHGCACYGCAPYTIYNTIYKIALCVTVWLPVYDNIIKPCARALCHPLLSCRSLSCVDTVALDD